MKTFYDAEEQPHFTPAEHYSEAERLLWQTTTSLNELAGGKISAKERDFALTYADLQFRMAHIHAILATAREIS